MRGLNRNRVRLGIGLTVVAMAGLESFFFFFFAGFGAACLFACLLGYFWEGGKWGDGGRHSSLKSL